MSLKKSNSVIYLTIVNGKLARTFKTPNENTEKRTNKNGVEVHEEYFKAVIGTITGLDTKVHAEYGEQLLIYITSKDGKHCVQTNIDSRYGVNFLKTLPNADLKKEIEISPSEKKLEDGKYDQTVFLRQNNVVLKRYYKKEQGELPEPTLKKGKRGQPDVWDWSPVTDFLFEQVLSPFREALKLEYPQGAASDDLPF